MDKKDGASLPCAKSKVDFFLASYKSIQCSPCNSKSAQSFFQSALILRSLFPVCTDILAISEEVNSADNNIIAIL